MCRGFLGRISGACGFCRHLLAGRGMTGNPWNPGDVSRGRPESAATYTSDSKAMDRQWSFSNLEMAASKPRIVRQGIRTQQATYNSKGTFNKEGNLTSLRQGICER